MSLVSTAASQAQWSFQWSPWELTLSAVIVIVAAWFGLYLRRHRRAQRMLRESEERFRAIFQQTGVGVAQISLDGRVEMANDRYCEVVGHTRDQLLGKGTAEITHREDLKEQMAMLPRLMAGEIQWFVTEKRYDRSDGTTMWAAVCKSLVRDGEGQPRGFIAVVEDISERKRAEAALKESEERFRNMADSAPVLIWVCGADNRCTFLNRGWLTFTGRRMEEEVGEGWSSRIHPEDHERFLATLSLSSEALRDFRIEYRLERADGEYRNVLNHAAVRLSDAGVFAGYIGSCIDVTDLHRNFERHLANQKLESLGVLAAGVAHDFNNSLGAIVARAECALTTLDSRAAATEDVKQIRLMALKAADVASQMMTFAGQENGPTAAVDISQLVSEMLDLLKVSISKTAVLKTELATALPPVRANAAEIRQVVFNLVINASEALGDQPGSITITAVPGIPCAGPGEAVLLEVADTGCGMTGEVKARIFDPFFTTHFTRRGLGLAAVQGIVRRHGGSIDVDSAPGCGSRFRVILPCGGQATQQQRLRSDPARPWHGALLLIEDEGSLRSSIAKLLRKRGFTVVEAEDGPSAVQALRADPEAVSLAILDITLPGMTGLEAFDELRRIKPDLKFVLNTAYAEQDVNARFQDRQGWKFIRKPYRITDLIKLIDGIAGESRGCA